LKWIKDVLFLIG